VDISITVVAEGDADVHEAERGASPVDVRVHQSNQHEYGVRAMCRVLGVAPSGDYEWLTYPVSNRAREDARLLRLIRASFIASQGIYGAPRVFLDLREAGEGCSKHRVARLMRVNQLRALHGYRPRRWSVGKPSVLIPNLLQRQFTVTRRTRPGSPTSHIRTWQGWLYLAVVMDLFSRKNYRLVGWVEHSPRTRAGRGLDGRAPPALPRCHDSFGSRNSVRERCMATLLPLK